MSFSLSPAAERLARDITEYVFAEDAPLKSDIIFVPGSMHIKHVLRAAELYHAGYAPYILPSGRFSVALGHIKEAGKEITERYGAGFRTEWEFMKTVLLSEGVPEGAILREDEAGYTWQNALFSKRVTDRLGMKIETAILCCRACHARRALTYYQAAYPDTRFLVCPAQGEKVDRENWYLTPEGRDKVLSELVKTGGQAREQLEMILTGVKQNLP